MSDTALYTLKQGERFSYETINLDYLRSRITLPEWLKKNKRTGAKVRYIHGYGSGRGDRLPGHPALFAFAPEMGNSRELDVRVIPDPENVAFSEVQYRRENKYEPNGGFRDNEERSKQNRYYVVFPSDYKKLFIPLPLNHERMRAWEVEMYMNYRTTFLGYNDEQFYYPPLSKDTVYVPEPKIEPYWNEELRQAVLKVYELKIKDAEAAAEASRQEREQYAKKYVLPERNLAVINIRKHFPDYQPRLDLLEDYHNDPAYRLIEPHRWFYRYASLAAMGNDLIENIGKK